jgi:hypothetical protein
MEYLKKQSINKTFLMVDQYKKENYFFLTNKRCRVIYLNYELSNSENNVLLLFNSKLYNDDDKQKDCFYFDNNTNTFYLTFGFYFKEKSFIKKNHFTIKEQLSVEESPKINSIAVSIYL